MIILGVDPGTATTGFGLVRKVKRRKKKNKRELKCLDYGLIKTDPSLSDEERLRELSNQINKLIRKYQPKILAIEKLYFFKNLKTAIPVAQAKGVILLAAAKKRIPVYEFTPLQMKMAITGYGRATKKQIQRMIKNLLNLKDLPKELPPDDAADALGLAICYIRSMKS